MMSFMVCMKQALQNRNSLSHEFSNDSTRVSLRFVDCSVGCLRLIGAWDEMHSILITPFTALSCPFLSQKQKAAARQPQAPPRRHHHRPPQNQKFPMRFL
ncbi:unnamed protein product [Sphagnum troendelagicum]